MTAHGLSTALKAGLLASHGYPTLALAYFAAPGLPPEIQGPTQGLLIDGRKRTFGL